MNNAAEEPGPSPFHAGEQAFQTLTGKREAMESFGQSAIRPFMPEQHRKFFAQLPFMLIGSVDDHGWPWASILSGKPGFVASPDPNTLTLNAAVVHGDPLRKILRTNAPLGLLGIEISTRRRNRLNVHVTNVVDGQVTLNVDQSFGNCPQYIQKRSVNFIRDPTDELSGAKTRSLTTLDEAAAKMIKAADTFFVSSYISPVDRPEIEGVDVSHRGGRPGFVKVEGNTLTVPEYPGNYHFNTLGNFLLNPKAGLMFLDFETGDVLQLTGTITLLDGDDATISAFKGAQRGWRFTLDHGTLLSGALPFRSALEEFSPNSLLAGNWQQAEAALNAEAQRKAWRPFRITRIKDESSLIRSFYLEPTDGDGVLSYKAGQFLTIQVALKNGAAPLSRTYTASSAPGDSYYRISVKREPDGAVSNFLHSQLTVGDIVSAKAPRGEFYLDVTEKRPAVLLAGGIGITPMIAMAQHVANESVRIRHLRQLIIFHAAQTTEQRAFSDDFRALEQSTDGAIRYFSIIGEVAPGEKAGKDFNGTGFINAAILRQNLALDDYDYFLCGPPPFMQAIYDALRGLGARDVRIFAEAFGPASLTRQVDGGTAIALVTEEAEDAIIQFAASGFEQRWNAGDGTLLEVAEKHGLTPDYGCRSGSCGSCATKLKSGSVAYRTEPSAPHELDEVLICCAVPAKGTDILEIDL